MTVFPSACSPWSQSFPDFAHLQAVYSELVVNHSSEDLIVDDLHNFFTDVGGSDFASSIPGQRVSN
jgi:hypothetical protein